MAVAPTTRRKVSGLVCGLPKFDLRIEFRAVGRAAQCAMEPELQRAIVDQVVLDALSILQSGDDDVSGER